MQYTNVMQSNSHHFKIENEPKIMQNLKNKGNIAELPPVRYHVLNAP